MNRPVEGWTANSYHEELDLRSLMTIKELDQLSREVGYKPSEFKDKSKGHASGDFERFYRKDSQDVKIEKQSISQEDSRSHFQDFLRWNRKQTNPKDKDQRTIERTIQPIIRSKFERYQPIKLDQFMVQQQEQSNEIQEKLKEIQRKVKMDIEQKARLEEENQRRIKIEQYHIKMQEKKKVQNPIQHCKDKLKQRLAELDRVNKEIDGINKIVRESRRKELGNSMVQSRVSSKINQEIAENEHFQHLVSHPPANSAKPPKNPQKVPNQATLTNSICIQTDNKAEIATQTLQRRKKLDMSKILQLNDHEFIDLFTTNRQQISLYATADQKLTLNNRYTKITSENNVRYVLKQVLEQAPTATLEKVSSKHKRKAYDFLYGSMA